MAQTVEQALANTGIHSDEQVYRLLSLPPNCVTLAAGVIAESGLPFSAIVVDSDEVTLLLREDMQRRFAKRLQAASVSDEQYRLITFSQVLEPDLVGFIARISDALARVNIAILAFAAYSRDHIFVPAQDFARAIKALQTSAGRYKTRTVALGNPPL